MSCDYWLNYFRASVGTMFALPWYLTWFGHSLNQYKDVVRLYDYFLASPPLMPLYVAASLVVQRRAEVFAEGCDMASIHCMLSQIPDNLDFEVILERASTTFKEYPPEKLEKFVKQRVNKEYVVFGLFYFLRKFYGFFKQMFSVQFFFFLLTSLFMRKYKQKQL